MSVLRLCGFKSWEKGSVQWGKVNPNSKMGCHTFLSNWWAMHIGEFLGVHQQHGKNKIIAKGGSTLTRELQRHVRLEPWNYEI